MKKVLKMALVALILFIGNNVAAQGYPTTPPPYIPAYSVQAMTSSNDDVSYDAGFSTSISSGVQNETHLLQTTSGGYVKITLTYNPTSGSVSNYNRTVITAGDFYAQRSQLESNSSLHSIPNAYDWD